MNVRRHTWIQLATLTTALMGAMTSCGPPTEGVEVSFKLPGGERLAFLETPWPSDVLRTDDGRIDLSAFPNPGNSTALEDYLLLFSTLREHSSATTFYFQVPGGVLEESLPKSAQASLAADATMFLSTVSGQRVPIEWKNFPEATSFVPAGTVAVRPVGGATFHEPAALVVTTRAKATNGDPLIASSDMRAVLACEVASVDCSPYLEVLARTSDHAALVQLVTPRDAAAGLVAAAARARAVERPLRGLTVVSENDRYTEYRAQVDLDRYLAGAPPFDTFDGVTGGFVDDDTGPAPQATESVEIAITVPKGEVPADGFGLALYGHGTGGSLESPHGVGSSSVAGNLADIGWMLVSVSEPLHRGREGFQAGQESILTFNFLNPVAGRDVFRQSVLEKVQLVTAMETLEVPGAEIDRTALAYIGHSQGGLIGALLAAVEDRLDGYFLSAAGGGFSTSIVEKTEPIALAGVLRTLLNLDADEEVDIFHPVPALVQHWIDEADPVAYARVFNGPRTRSPHVVAVAGLQDEFTPRGTQAALAGAYRLPIVSPVSEVFDVVEVLGVGSVSGPASLNQIRERRVTRGMLQYPDDGHFPVFFNPDARAAYAEFFTGLRAGAPLARVR